MARYTGPVWKQSRRLKYSVLETGKELVRRPYAPGQHGQRRAKLSEYGIQLQEKQKVRFTYGMTEKQFHNLFLKASKLEGKAGENFIFLLESRLDNLVYRMGIAPTRAAARQLVSHCHIVVDGDVCNIPSTILRPGQVIGVRERSKSLEVIQNVVADTCRYSWIEWNRGELSGKFLNLPERTEIPETINEQLIVELYSK